MVHDADPESAASDEEPPWLPGVAGARAAQATSLSALHDWWREAERRADPATLAGWAVEALQTMAGDDSTTWGMRACDVLRRHGGADEAEALQRIRGALPPRKGLRDWRVEADRARSVMLSRGDGGCTCAAEARHGAPVHGDQWQVESERVDHAQYGVVSTVRCRCGRRWQVLRHDGYHYPVFRWTAHDGAGEG